MSTPRNISYTTALIVALIGASTLVAALGGVTMAADLTGFELAAENDWLQLYLNEKTVEFAVREKESGEVWYSNPYDRQRKETVAGGANKAMLNAQVVLTYYIANRQFQMDSYNDSVAHGQYEIHPISNGFRIDYTIGRMWKDEDYLPTMISEERFNEEILPRIENPRDRTFLRGLYAQFQLEEGYVDSDQISIAGVDMEALLGDYGLKVAGNLRAADKRRLLQEYLIRIRDAKKYTGLEQVKHEDVAPLIDTPTLMLRWDVKQWDKEDAAALLKESGYGAEQVVLDHEMYGILPPFPDLRQFKVSVEYVLDGESLLARIPGERIVYPLRVWDPADERYVTYPLTSISLLNYFGASDVDSRGYIVIPDGSGALIEANSGKTTASPYNRRVYGRDFASSASPELTTVDLAQIHLPVFGLKDNDRAFLAVIEEGDGMARIEATVAKMRDSFNKVWASFDFIPQVAVFLDAEGELIHLRRLSINMYQSRPYLGNMTVRYTFLTGDEANYPGMARAYQEYLVSRHGLDRLTPAPHLPLVLDVVGAIDRLRPVMGVPRRVVEPLTTYAQVGEIVDDLLAKGVGGAVLRYQGWLKGGINHVFPAGVSLEGAVGGEGQLKALAASLAERGVPLYPDVSFGLVRRDGLMDGFVGFRDASRFLNRRQAYMNTYNIATYQAIDNRRVPLLSPARYSSVVSSFAAEFTPLGVGNLSLNDLGRLLYSDFRVDPNELVDRETAKTTVVDQVRALSGAGLDLMIEGANAYVLPFTKIVANTPLYSRGSAIVDRSIPFYQMVLSGYIAYAAPPINLADIGGRAALLKLAETGTAPAFAVAYASSAEVKHTTFDDRFSIAYRDLSHDIETFYHELSGVIGGVWHQRIIDHQCLTIELCQTTWEDGSRVVVNYGRESNEAFGVDVPAQGYVFLPPGPPGEEGVDG